MNNADKYQEILIGEVMPGIAARGIKGYRNFEAMRREIVDEDGEAAVEFTTLMWFDDLDAVKAFVGEDYEVAHVPAKPRTVLKRFDERSKHYEVLGDGERA